MIDPVPSGIRGDGKVTYGISLEFFIELEEDTEANTCKERMRRFGENVIKRKMFFGLCESLRCQELLGREMRELNYSAASLIDGSDETGACGQHRPFYIAWP